MNNELFKNKYRVQSTRLKNWDYSSSGWYFITVCTKNKQYLFGENIEFEWQAKFYDHIVRDNDDFLRIQKYIIENPQNWENDKFYNE